MARKIAPEPDDRRPWSSRDLARAAVLGEFRQAIGDRAEVQYRVAGAAFSDTREWLKALDEIVAALDGLRRPLKRVQRAGDAITPLAQKENEIRKGLGAQWVAITFGTHELLHFAEEVRETVVRAKGVLDPASALGVRGTMENRFRVAVCRRLQGGLLREILGPHRPARLLMLLAIAHASETAFTGSSATGTYNARIVGWSNAWRAAETMARQDP